MNDYDGFSFECGCHCWCGGKLHLEGYTDATGPHFCTRCDNFEKPIELACKGRTPEAIAARQKEIEDSGM